MFPDRDRCQTVSVSDRSMRDALPEDYVQPLTCDRTLTIFVNIIGFFVLIYVYILVKVVI